MNREIKKKYRADLFKHLDGIVTAPVAFALHQKGVLDYILQEKKVTLSVLGDAFQANEGYLNIALHMLASQGWLDYELDENQEIELSCNALSEIAFQYIPAYEDVVKLMRLSEKYHPRKFEKEPFLALENIFQKFQENYGFKEAVNEEESQVQLQILKHIEGIIVGPTVVALGMSGMFHNYFMQASFRPEEFHKDGEIFGRLLDIFVALGWFEKKSQNYRFTEKGMFYARRASAYGVTVSYIPTFRKVDELIFGDPRVLWNVPKGAKEAHVDREMNVWGSGGAHASYFKVVDEIIIDIFNQPIEQQPKGIVDMGCGNGAFLIHLYEVIESRTIRGELLEEHPLFLVGADYNEAALSVTRTNLIQAGIWAKLIWGDIGQPDLLANDLHDNYDIQLEDLLNVRTFLDHNRIWSDPVEAHATENSPDLGAYAYRGRRISPQEVQSNLKEHLQKWSPYVRKYGLLVIELHTLSPSVIAAHLGKTAATAYNATHGFSDQYIVDIKTFHDAAKAVGLLPDEKHFIKFPDSDIATVSINLLKQG